jgi:hypothetical protein
MRDNFIFYRSWEQVIEQLPAEVQSELYKRIAKYGIHGTEPDELSETAKIVWSFIKPQMDANREKYERMCNKSKKGCKKQTELATDETAKTEVAREKKKESNTKKKDKENDNDNENEEKKINSESLSKKAALSLPQAQDFEKIKNKEDMEKRAKVFYDSLVPYIPFYGRTMLREFYDYWTEPTHDGTKMRFELKKNWSLERRLRVWDNNSFRFGTNKKVDDDDGKVIYV